MPNESFRSNIEDNNRLNPILDQILSDCVESGEDPLIYAERNGINLRDQKMFMLIGLSLRKMIDVEKLKVLKEISEKLNIKCEIGKPGCGGFCNTGLCPKAIDRRIKNISTNNESKN